MELVGLLVENLFNGAEGLLALVLGDLEHRALRALEQVTSGRVP